MHTIDKFIKHLVQEVSKCSNALLVSQYSEAKKKKKKKKTQKVLSIVKTEQSSIMLTIFSI